MIKINGKELEVVIIRGEVMIQQNEVVGFINDAYDKLCKDKPKLKGVDKTLYVVISIIGCSGALSHEVVDGVVTEKSDDETWNTVLAKLEEEGLKSISELELGSKNIPSHTVFM